MALDLEEKLVAVAVAAAAGSVKIESSKMSASRWVAALPARQPRCLHC